MRKEGENGPIFRSVSVSGEPVRHSVDPVALTQELVRIPSHNDLQNEAENIGTIDIIDYTEDIARQLGLETHRVPTINKDGTVAKKDPNLIIGRGLEDLPIILLGTHIDTVQPYPQGEHPAHSGDLSDGKVYGVGATDSKGAGASMLAAIATARNELPTSFGVLFTAREETDLAGIKAVAGHFEELQNSSSGKKIDLIVGGGSDNEVATGSRGVLEAEFTLEGRTSHTSKRAVFDFSDAIEARDSIVGSLKDRINSIPEHTTYGRTSFKRTADRGGFYNGKNIVNTTNQVASRSSATLGIRLNGMPFEGKELTPDVLQNTLSELVDQYQNDGISLVDYNTLAFVRAAITEPEKVQWIVDMVEEKTGRKMARWDYGNRGLEELVELVSVLDPAPSLLITGPADQSQYHQPDESVRTESLQQWEDIYRNIVTDKQFRNK